jgi:hypothetical protein
MAQAGSGVAWRPKRKGRRVSRMVRTGREGFMHLRSAVCKGFGALAIGLLLAGCGEELPSTGPVEPNVGPGGPAGVKAGSGSAKKPAAPAPSPSGGAAPAK